MFNKKSVENVQKSARQLCEAAQIARAEGTHVTVTRAQVLRHAEPELFEGVDDATVGSLWNVLAATGHLSGFKVSKGRNGGVQLFSPEAEAAAEADKARKEAEREAKRAEREVKKAEREAKRKLADKRLEEAVKSLEKAS